MIFSAGYLALATQNTAHYNFTIKYQNEHAGRANGRKGEMMK
jgi:hypothetical protein